MTFLIIVFCFSGWFWWVQKRSAFNSIAWHVCIYVFIKYGNRRHSINLVLFLRAFLRQSQFRGSTYIGIQLWRSCSRLSWYRKNSVQNNHINKVHRTLVRWNSQGAILCPRLNATVNDTKNHTTQQSIVFTKEKNTRTNFNWLSPVKWLFLFASISNVRFQLCVVFSLSSNQFHSTIFDFKSNRRANVQKSAVQFNETQFNKKHNWTLVLLQLLNLSTVKQL